MFSVITVSVIAPLLLGAPVGHVQRGKRSSVHQSAASAPRALRIFLTQRGLPEVLSSKRLANATRIVLAGTHREALLTIEAPVVVFGEGHLLHATITPGKRVLRVELELELALDVAGRRVAADLDADVVDLLAVEDEVVDETVAGVDVVGAVVENLVEDELVDANVNLVVVAVEDVARGGFEDGGAGHVRLVRLLQEDGVGGGRFGGGNHVAMLYGCGGGGGAIEGEIGVGGVYVEAAVRRSRGSRVTTLLFDWR
ncbi:hypothetical protein FGB62_143g07 [Gracilaria domingensis]|nr:hypothetical protein FGB62_143g07 [Gracilaria domingensis]